jgi:threonine dehydratase
MLSTVLSLPTFNEICSAQTRLNGIAIRSPLIKLNYDVPHMEIYLKCEQFQPISSFKIRGASNAVKVLSFEEKQHGIVTASAGNMAQGLAWIARKENIPCRVLVPDTANAVKLKAIERLGAEVTKCAFEQWWQVIVTHRCSMLPGYFIHPVCNRHVMAGNGTIALEILDELPDCDAILGREDCHFEVTSHMNMIVFEKHYASYNKPFFLVPYGGGALISGIAASAKHLKPSIDIVACEIETAAPLAAALRHGKITEVSMRKSWVDGIGSSSVLVDMWPIVQQCVDQSIVVSLEETAAALKLLIEANHFICEGASATSLAAALWHYETYVKNGQIGQRKYDTSTPMKIVAVLSGAGIDDETIIKCLRDTL